MYNVAEQITLHPSILVGVSQNVKGLGKNAKTNLRRADFCPPQVRFGVLFQLLAAPPRKRPPYVR